MRGQHAIARVHRGISQNPTNQAHSLHQKLTGPLRIESFRRSKWWTLAIQQLTFQHRKGCRIIHVVPLWQLDQLHPGLEAQAPLGATATMGSSIEQLDLTTVVRALQAVSREIDLEKLIETLLASALEHAGAERALLFLRHGSEQRIEAKATTHADLVEVTFSPAFAAPPEWPESVLTVA